LRDWRLRGINHEGVQSVKMAERLGLLIKRGSGFFVSRLSAISVSFQLFVRLIAED